MTVSSTEGGCGTCCGMMQTATAVLCSVLLLLHGAACMSGSKLSIHTSMGDESWDVISQGLPRLVKLLDSFSDADKIKATVPGIIIVR